jgi:hypothetical protein
MEILIKWAMAVSIFFATLQMLDTGVSSIETDTETVKCSKSGSVKNKATCSRLRPANPADTLVSDKGRLKVTAGFN